MTFQELVRAERMKRAKNLLKETTLPVEIISGNVGYENVEHFIRLFKKSCGKTPAQFRREIG